MCVHTGAHMQSHSDFYQSELAAVLKNRFKQMTKKSRLFYQKSHVLKRKQYLPNLIQNGERVYYLRNQLTLKEVRKQNSRLVPCSKITFSVYRLLYLIPGNKNKEAEQGQLYRSSGF